MHRRHLSEPSAVVAGTVLAQRYRLDATIQNSNPIQGVFWRGVDILEGDTSVVLRQISDAPTRQRFQKFWPELQSLSHPQLPRCGELFEAEVSLWAVRYWQEGVTYRKLQQQRAERQLVFGAGEVLQLLLQLLPSFIELHAKGLVHGDINLSNLLRRHQDGLPALLDFGLLQPQGTTPWGGVTSASIAQSSSEPAEAWMDLHGLGVTALTLLTGRCPEELWNSDVRSWGWPESFEVDGSFRHVLERMLSEAPDQRFEKASDVICALQAVIMPESIGPKPIADRTLALAPQVVPLSDPPSRTSQSLLTEHRPANQPRRRRAEEREQAAEGRLWSVVGALLASALVGTAIGWFLLSRSSPLGMDPVRDRDLVGNVPVESPSAVEVDHRQQLLSRLRALQVKQSWFLQLVDASVLARFPHRGGRFPSDALDDVPLRQAWNDLAEEWLVRIEQLSPQLRRRLGELKNTDWQEQREGLSELGAHGRVIEQLVTAGAQKLLLGSFNDQKPPEPYLQFWYAAAMRSLADVQIETLKARPSIPTVFSTRVSPGAARLISIQVPSGHRLVLEINGTPLMQMTIYGSQGDVIAERGSLRVVTLEPEAGSPVQVLVTNEGLATALLTLSCRADQQSSMPLPALNPNPLPDSATGFLGRPEHPSRTTTLPRASAKENFVQPH